MARPPVLSGSLPDGGPIELLREVEQRRVTGRLAFESDDGAKGEVRFYGGEIAVEQDASPDGSDPVDALLSLESGTFELHQELPPLAVSRGTDYERHGSLAVHVPADLMNYCEHAGLSGKLVLTHEGHKAEATYDAGELLAIELDGSAEVDLSEVFAWEQGRFRVILDPSAPEAIAPALEEELGLPQVPVEHKPRKGENTRQFLRVVEMALADVTHQSEKARSPTRTSPPLPPPPPKRPRPRSVPPPPKRRTEHTVKLIYLSDDAPRMDEDRSTRHVARSGSAEMALTEARPERRPKSAPEIELDEELMAKKKKKRSKKAQRPASAPAKAASSSAAEEPKATRSTEPKPEAAKPAPSAAKSDAPKEKAETPPGNPAMGLLWAAVVLGVGLAILAFLAFLPPISCPPGQDNCGWGKGCVATSRDVENCGGCDIHCGAGESCQWGECQADEATD